MFLLVICLLVATIERRLLHEFDPAADAVLNPQMCVAPIPRFPPVTGDNLDHSSWQPRSLGNKMMDEKGKILLPVFELGAYIFPKNPNKALKKSGRSVRSFSIKLEIQNNIPRHHKRGDGEQHHARI